MKSAACAAIAFLLAAASTSHAQSHEGSGGYVQGSFVVTHKLEGEYERHASPQLEGTGMGAAMSIGRFVRPTIALEANVVTTGVSAGQHYGYMETVETYTSTFRLTALNWLLRWRPVGTSLAEIVGGGGLAVARLSKHDGTRSGLGQTWQVPMPDSTSSATVPTLTGGIDVVLPVSARVAWVGSLRGSWRGRAESAGFSGSNRTAFDFGAGLRVRF